MPYRHAGLPYSMVERLRDLGGYHCLRLTILQGPALLILLMVSPLPIATLPHSSSPLYFYSNPYFKLQIITLCTGKTGEIKGGLAWSLRAKINAQQHLRRNNYKKLLCKTLFCRNNSAKLQNSLNGKKSAL